jgi:hypothetical protein
MTDEEVTMTTTMPLWQRYAQMTPEQFNAEVTRNIERMKSGEISAGEADELHAAMGRAIEHQKKQLEHVERIGRLARATDCPANKPILPWLVKKGLLARTPSDEYYFTPKANLGGKGEWELLIMDREVEI